MDPTDDFTFIEAEDAVQCAKAITYLAREYIPKTHHIDPIKDLQILSPMHRGSAGIAALNTALQESLNDTGKALSRLRSDPDYVPARQSHFRETTRKPLPAELAYGTTTTASATK